MYHTSPIRQAARDCGFELCGFTVAVSSPDLPRYQAWTASGFAAGLRYLTDHRAALREDPRHLLPSARSIICLGKVYNWPAPYSTALSDNARAWIARYAWGDDYHDTMRRDMTRLVNRLDPAAEYRICVDTAPLLERSYARLAGLGWIGRNTCLINQQLGSWIFLGEILTSLEIEPDAPPPDRCGTCTRCIDVCPTHAIVPARGHYAIDSNLCISYFTIEHRGSIPEDQRAGLGHHVFGCDICQDVCPWNSRAAITEDPRFAPRHDPTPFEELAALTEAEFRALYRDTPVSRAKYSGFLRNVALAMGNSGNPKLRAPLEKLAQSEDPVVAESAVWALEKLGLPAKQGVA